MSAAINTDPLASRRVVFRGVSALGVAAALAGCGGGDDRAPTGASESSPSESSPSESGPGEPSVSTSSEPAGPANLLVATDEVPVGGGVVLRDELVVVTQPRAGQFEAFTATCTHQGNPVGVVEDNTITCQFHGSQYDASTGEVTRGPATTGLTPVRIRVRKGQVLRA